MKKLMYCGYTSAGVTAALNIAASTMLWMDSLNTPKHYYYYPIIYVWMIHDPLVLLLIIGITNGLLDLTGKGLVMGDLRIMAFTR